MRSRSLALALLLPLAACGTGTDADRRDADLVVLAASSLSDVYQELATGFEEEQGVEVTFSFGSSTDLAGQAADGAPGDVLATADEISMQVAEDAGVTGPVTRFATNALVLVTPPEDPAGVSGLADLDGATWVRCADEVPCGRVAVALLDDHGVTAEPASLEDDARATLDKVTSGEADAGLVYRTDAHAAGPTVRTTEIPGAAEHRATYAITTLDQGDSELAAAWVDHVTSEEAEVLLQEAGFTLP